MIYTMEQIAEIIDGDRGIHYPKQNEFLKEGHCIFLNTGNVTANGFSFENKQYITQEKDLQLRKGKLQKGDIVYTTRGTVGNAAYYNDTVPYENLRINSGMVILKCKADVVDGGFLYQLLRNSVYRLYFRQYCTGSAQPQLPIKNFSKIELDIPDLSTQRRITGILFAYDSLIENNQRQIKLLEEAARRLYREWFVDLRFPGHKHVQIVDGVPEGWNILRLCDVASITMGQSPKSEYFNEDKIGLPFHQGVGSYGVRFVQDKIYSTSATRIAEARSILFSVRAPVGRLNITKERIVIGRGLAAICHKRGLQSFLYYMLKDKFFKEDIIGNGSIFASISKEELHQQKLLIPNDELCEKFDALASMIDKKIENLDSQVRLATEARDRLLPKLMSGEIEL